jgi:uncharacterized membrane protein YjfL (UPF0719 family)
MSIYIFITVTALAVIAILFFRLDKNKETQLSTLAGLSFSLILAGIFFGTDRVLGYSLIGLGVLLALIDIYKKTHKNLPV